MQPSLRVQRPGGPVRVVEIACHHSIATRQYEVHGQYDEAEAAYRKAIDLDSSNAWSWGGLGSLLADRVGRYEEAEAAFDNAVKLQPDENWFYAKWSQIRHRRILAPMIAAVAAENWGIVREQLEQWIADPQAGLELWVSDAFIDDVVGAAVRLGRGEPLLRLMREVGLERVAFRCCSPLRLRWPTMLRALWMSNPRHVRQQKISIYDLPLPHRSK
jgi:tetratricopeptide (TPR) repeat protein